MNRNFWAFGTALALVWLISVNWLPNPPQRQRSLIPTPAWSAHDEVAAFARQIQHIEPPCTPVGFGTSWGKHALCARRYSKPCSFFSFGISTDWSFDTELAAKTGCSGYALDPSISHPTNLAPGVMFLQVAARSLENGTWPVVTTLPRLSYWLNALPSVVKFDAEGAEFALAADVRDEMPGFWETIDQFAVEFHLCRKFMSTPEHFYNFALLLRQLREAGLRVAHYDVTGCNPILEAEGCLPELMATGYPCKPQAMCPSFLFVK